MAAKVSERFANPTKGERKADGGAREGNRGEDANPNSSSVPVPVPVPSSSSTSSSRAFAIVDDVARDSPGAIDGLRPGDRVCAVGDVRWTHEDSSARAPQELIARAARAFAESENSPVRVLVSRRGDVVEVSVTPRAWSGAGLVGCHMRPM